MEEDYGDLNKVTEYHNWKKMKVVNVESDDEKTIFEVETSNEKYKIKKYCSEAVDMVEGIVPTPSKKDVGVIEAFLRRYFL